MNNLYESTPTELSREITEQLLATAGVRIERIVSHGHASPDGFWYDQQENEWVVVLRGRARLRFAGNGPVKEMGPGDYVHIPAGKRHRVEWTTPDEPTIWLAVFYSSNASSND